MGKTQDTLILVLAAFSQVAMAENITVDDSFEPPLRSNLQAIANDVWEIVKDLFDGDPPIDLPIYCHRGPFPYPLTELDTWERPTRIVIHLNLNGPFYAQFTYQLAHELGHVMLNPRRSNGVVETICNAVSYEALDRMTEKWTMAVPFSHLRGYELNFRKYRSDDEKSTLARLTQISSAVDQGKWLEVRRYLYVHRSEQDQLTQVEIQSEHGRDIQNLGAMALRSSAVPWKKFLGLAVCGQFTSVKAQPRYQLTGLPNSCITALSGALCPIGRGCRGLVP